MIGTRTGMTGSQTGGYKESASRAAQGLLAVLLMAASEAAPAVEFEFGELRGKLDNQASVGAGWRVENQDPRLIAKANLNPGICLRDSGGGDQNPATTLGDGCNSSSNPALNDAFVARRGSFAPNTDNGDLNYDKGDFVSGAFKFTSDLSMSWRDWGAFVRGTYFYDEPNTNFNETHPDTTFQPSHTKRPRKVEKLVGNDFELLDAYVYTSFQMPGDRELTVRVGSQVVNWGESTFLVLGSINSVNPPHAARLRAPGLDVKEILVPVGLVFMGMELVPSLTLEGFYQYDWQPAVPDPVGSFFSTSDVAGAGGTYAMLSFGKAPEDPHQSYDPKTNDDDATGLFSSSSRTILRTSSEKPSDSGQYGAKLSYFAEDFNNGTEFSFYHMNYHSRFPIASLIAAEGTCVPENATNVVGALTGCGLGGTHGRLGLASEPLPVETAKIFLEYPEDIKLYGTSFNTTVGNWAWSGEIAYRPNQPLQIHTTDLIFAALQPAFPANDVPICAGLGGAPVTCVPSTPIVAVVPGRRSSAPDFVMTKYRNHPLTSADAGAYIRGYESMKVMNIGTTFLNTISASNPLKADQIVMVIEVGGTKVFDMPGLDELQFAAAGADTHISSGADGSSGAGGNQVGAGCLALDADSAAETASRACRQNPTAERRSAFPDDFSWGFRSVAVIRYQNVFAGVNLEPLIGWFHDVKGIAPGPAENFIEGRSTYLLGLRADYLSKWSGELRYTMESGAGFDNARLDRDNISLVARYEF